MKENEMDYHILPYRECDKEQVFAFTDACFTELGKSFDPDGRHSFYQDISKSFTAFWCMFADDVVIGTVALKKHSSESIVSGKGIQRQGIRCAAAADSIALCRRIRISECGS